jgi:site-specific DNA recombinase
MKDQTTRRSLRGAIYTRVSTDQGLEQDFNSLDAQREACEAYLKSQAHEGWRLVRDRYDDAGFSGGSMDRPALQKLLADVQARRIDVIVVYKVDRLTRSLADFAKLVETFDAHGVSFVSVTQSFNTTTSMGRLTLNVLLSFAQFEREVAGERIRDKIAASKKKGMWMGGVIPLGYRVEARALHIVDDHAAIVRSLFRRYLEAGSVVRLKQQLDAEGVRIPVRIDGGCRSTGGGLLSRGHIYKILSNPIYVGRIAHKGQVHEGQHPPIVPQELWEQVQRDLRDHLGAAGTERTRQSSDALLAGKLYDDGGNRMSPTWARKGSKRWRYYVSQAALQGDKSKAGSIRRVPAADVEILVAETSTCRWPGRISGARSDSRRQRRRNERSTLARLSSGDELIHPSEPAQRVEVQTRRAVRNRARGAHGKQQPWKRNFAARDFRPCAPPVNRTDGGVDLADRLLPPQAAGMSCCSAGLEITSICADFLVELRGFEPLTSLAGC